MVLLQAKFGKGRKYFPTLVLVVCNKTFALNCLIVLGGISISSIEVLDTTNAEKEQMIHARLW